MATVQWRKPGEQKLREAARDGEVPLVRELLATGTVDVNGMEQWNSGGRTALIMGAMQGNAEVCKLLLESGANIDARDIHGCTALVHATRHGHASVCSLLLERGADLQGQTIFGWTALMFAAVLDSAEICLLFVEAGANPFVFNNDGETVDVAFCNDTIRDVLDEGDCRIGRRHGLNHLSVAAAMTQSTLFQRCVWYLQRHAGEYDAIIMKEVIPDHLQWEFFPHTQWGVSLECNARSRPFPSLLHK